MRRGWVRFLPRLRAPYCLGQCQYNDHGLPALSRVWQHVKLSDVSLGTRPRYSLVVDENKQTKQAHGKTRTLSCLASYEEGE